MLPGHSPSLKRMRMPCPPAHTHRTHRGLLHARLRRARHQATATDTGPGPPPANATTVRPRMRRPRLTCPAARLSPRPTSRPAVALLPARHWAPPGARDSLTKPRRRGWIWLWYKLICTRHGFESILPRLLKAPFGPSVVTVSSCTNKGIRTNPLVSGRNLSQMVWAGRPSKTSVEHGLSSAGRWRRRGRPAAHAGRQ